MAMWTEERLGDSKASASTFDRTALVLLMSSRDHQGRTLILRKSSPEERRPADGVAPAVQYVTTGPEKKSGTLELGRKTQMRREKMAVLEKRPLTSEMLEAQTAFELPDREPPALIVIGCVVGCVGQIIVRDVNVGVAAAACLNVAALNNIAALISGLVGQTVELDCDVQGGGVDQQ
jgi:hypothetical protein